jgi:hypothetical protein
MKVTFQVLTAVLTKSQICFGVTTTPIAKQVLTFRQLVVHVQVQLMK